MQFTKLAAAAAMVALTCASMAASAYSATPYAVPGSASTQLWGINDHGVLVGSDAKGAAIVQRLFPVTYWKHVARDLARRIKRQPA